MSKLLYLQASPRQRSHSTQVARLFIELFLQKNPLFKLEELALGVEKLPVFAAAAVQAKFKNNAGIPFSSEEESAWRAARQQFERFQQAEKVVFSVPMWNFSFPYHLKQYIDLITQVGWCFAVDKNGAYQPLMADKPALFVYASGGVYDAEPMAALDQMRPYLRFWAGFVGLKYQEISIAGTNMGQVGEKSKQNAAQIAEKLADKF